MRVAVVVGTGMAGLATHITSVLDEMNVIYRSVEKSSRQDLKESELVVVVGSDKNILQVFHQIEEDSLPVLGVGDSDGGSFLTEASVHGFRDAFKSILEGDYTV